MKLSHLIINSIILTVFLNFLIIILLEKYLFQSKQEIRVLVDDNYKNDQFDSSELKKYYEIIYASFKNIPYCSAQPILTKRHIKIKFTSLLFDPFQNKLINYNKNYRRLNSGRFKPVNCLPRHRLAIIIPYKNRLDQLKYFLNHMHPFLQNQQLEYQIFVVEQSNDQIFNKGILMNAGFLEILKLNKTKLNKIDFKKQYFTFDCVIFHDVDLLPLTDLIAYSCGSKRPRHLSVAIDKFKFKNFYAKLIGGVLNFKIEHFIHVNGYSNQYWGWGGEDDDMEMRLSGLKIHYERPHVSIARYSMIKHSNRTKNPLRKSLLKQAFKRIDLDGLRNVEYKLVNINNYRLFTHILIDVGDPPDYILDILKSIPLTNVTQKV